MSATVLSHRYISAYINCFEEEQKLEAATDLGVALDQIIAQPKIQSLFLNPSVPATKKEELVAGLVSCKNKLLVNFLMLLIKKGRASLFLSMKPVLTSIISELNQTIVGHVVSSTTFTKEEEDSVVSFLSRYFNSKASITLTVDESLLAGFKIIANNLEFDATLDYSLGKLRAAFK